MKFKDQKTLDKEIISVLVVHGSNNSPSIVNCKEYSSQGRLLRVTATVLKFVKLLESRVKHDHPPITTEQITSNVEIA